eukprot:COSAG05_NODE_2148_length_3476_cov_4.365709_3_plen_147_part_00
MRAHGPGQFKLVGVLVLQYSCTAVLYYDTSSLRARTVSSVYRSICLYTYVYICRSVSEPSFDFLHLTFTCWRPRMRIQRAHDRALAMEMAPPWPTGRGRMPEGPRPALARDHGVLGRQHHRETHRVRSDSVRGPCVLNDAEQSPTQ